MAVNSSSPFIASQEDLDHDEDRGRRVSLLQMTGWWPAEGDEVPNQRQPGVARNDNNVSFLDYTSNVDGEP